MPPSRIHPGNTEDEDVRECSGLASEGSPHLFCSCSIGVRPTGSSAVRERSRVIAGAVLRAAREILRQLYPQEHLTFHAGGDASQRRNQTGGTKEPENWRIVEACGSPRELQRRAFGVCARFLEKEKKTEKTASRAPVATEVGAESRRAAGGSVVTDSEDEQEEAGEEASGWRGEEVQKEKEKKKVDERSEGISEALELIREGEEESGGVAGAGDGRGKGSKEEEEEGKPRDEKMKSGGGRGETEASHCGQDPTSLSASNKYQYDTDGNNSRRTSEGEEEHEQLETATLRKNKEREVSGGCLRWRSVEVFPGVTVCFREADEACSEKTVDPSEGTAARETKPHVSPPAVNRHEEQDANIAKAKQRRGSLTPDGNRGKEETEELRGPRSSSSSRGGDELHARPSPAPAERAREEEPQRRSRERLPSELSREDQQGGPVENVWREHTEETNDRKDTRMASLWMVLMTFPLCSSGSSRFAGEPHRARKEESRSLCEPAAHGEEKERVQDPDVEVKKEASTKTGKFSQVSVHALAPSRY